MGLFSKLKKGVTKGARSFGAVNAGIVSGFSLGLVKPKTLGVKSESATHLANQTARGVKVGVAATAVAVGGAGLAGSGPLSFLSKFNPFAGKTPAVPLSQSGLPTGAPGEPESTFGSAYNQRLETLGQVDPTGGFSGQIPVTGGILQNKMVLIGLGIAVLLAGFLVFRRK